MPTQDETTNEAAAREAIEAAYKAVTAGELDCYLNTARRLDPKITADQIKAIEELWLENWLRSHAPKP